jgi:hypothetical protein
MIPMARTARRRRTGTGTTTTGCPTDVVLCATKGVRTQLQNRDGRVQTYRTEGKRKM